MAGVIRFKTQTVSRQAGELARVRILKGPDEGNTFVLTRQSASVGRGEECDIVLTDLKTSRLHAQMKSTSSGWIIKDLGSANGVLINGNRNSETQLKSQDLVTLGETVFEFFSKDAPAHLLQMPPQDPDSRARAQENFKVYRKQVIAQAMGKVVHTVQKQATPFNSKLLLVGAAIAAAAYLFLDDGTPEKKKGKKALESRNLASYLPQSEPNKAAEVLYRDALREYFQGNYLRARTQFETVLQISPGHPQATMYLENCVKAVNTEVKIRLSHGRKALEAGKLRTAKAHFSQILRLLHKDPTSPEYIEAKDQLEVTQKLLKDGGESG